MECQGPSTDSPHTQCRAQSLARAVDKAKHLSQATDVGWYCDPGPRCYAWPTGSSWGRR